MRVDRVRDRVVDWSAEVTLRKDIQLPLKEELSVDIPVPPGHGGYRESRGKSAPL